MLKWIKNLFRKNKNAPEYRVVKSIDHDEIMLEIVEKYWIERKNTVNWYVVSPEFETYDQCLKWYSKYQEFVKNKELQYTYINKD